MHVSEQTTGNFLVEKTGNMARWLKSEGNPIDLPPLTPMKAVFFAQQLLAKHGETLTTRNFATLLADKEIPPEVLMSISFVQKNPNLHEKFWRYCDLFSDCVK